LCFGKAFLSHHPYLDKSSFRDRSKAIDKLLVKLARRMKRADITFNPVAEVEDICEQNQQMEQPGAENFFPATINLFSSWANGPKYVQSFYDDLKSEIYITYAETLSEESAGTNKHHGTLSGKMTNFIPRIRRLGNMSLIGSKLAFDLVLYLGRLSYIENPIEYGRSRTSSLDRMTDDLFLNLAAATKAEDPNFKPVEAFEILKCEI